MVTFSGTCKFKLIEGFFPCSDKVILVQFQNGMGAQYVFVKDETLFILSSHSDRQPNLENYYSSIDKLEIMKAKEIELSDNRMEGECHMKLNSSATEFYSIDREVYDRAKGIGFSFILDDINSFDKKQF